MATDLQSGPFPFDTAHRFTIAEYHRLVEERCLEEIARSVELLDGRIVPLSPIGPRHHWIVNKLLHAFIRQGRQAIPAGFSGRRNQCGRTKSTSTILHPTGSRLALF